MSGKSDYGKGDRPRPFNRKKWYEWWDAWEKRKQEQEQKEPDDE